MTEGTKTDFGIIRMEPAKRFADGHLVDHVRGLTRLSTHHVHAHLGVGVEVLRDDPLAFDAACRRTAELAAAQRGGRAPSLSVSWLFAIGGVDTIDVHADASTIPPGAPATLAEGRPWTRPRALAEWIASLDLSVFTLIATLTVVYNIIGCFLDGISAVVLTMAVVEPMVNIPAFREVGFTMIWLGIFVTVVAEMAQITPPSDSTCLCCRG